MVSRQNRLLGILLVFGVVSCGLGGCTSPSDAGSGAGGTTSSGGTSTGGSGGGSGGTTSSGGSSSTGGTTSSGGSTTSGGTTGSGGAQETGGTVGTGGRNSGGTTTTGGTSAGGAATGGSTATGGGAGSGGRTGAGGTVTGSGGAGRGGAGSGGRTGTGGATNVGTGGSTVGGAGGTSTGGCVKGQVKAQEVVIMGESFYAMAPQYIQKRVEENARKAGALGANETYRNVAVSGQPMSYIASTEWTNASKSPTKFVIMDGGGIDCMSSECPTCPDTFKTLLGKMATAGVLDVIYTRYPEPGNPPGSNTTLKNNLDKLMPKMETVCKGSTAPRCFWVDLRPVWVNGDTTDGLHPTQSGGNHVGDAIWAEMVKQCLAQ